MSNPAEPTVDFQPNSVEMEETVARIRTHKGVEAVIIMDRRGKKKRMQCLHLSYNDHPIQYFLGAIIQSTLDEEKSIAHAAVLTELTARASNVVEMLHQDADEGDDELTFLRLRSKHREVMVS
jgi:dynein light chain roadblock-type